LQFIRVGIGRMFGHQEKRKKYIYMFGLATKFFDFKGESYSYGKLFLFLEYSVEVTGFSVSLITLA
jgi:hypothetical protein